MIGCSKKKLIAIAPDSLCCMLVKKSLFSDLVFPEIRNGEDIAIIPILISKAKNIGFVKECLYNYAYRDNSLSKKFTKSMVDSLQESFLYIEKGLSTEYKEEIEFLGIKNYLYSATLNLFKSEKMPSRLEVDNIVNFYLSKYNNWSRNKYYSLLPKYKRIYLFAVKYKMYYMCRVFSILHKVISK